MLPLIAQQDVGYATRAPSPGGHPSLLRALKEEICELVIAGRLKHGDFIMAIKHSPITTRKAGRWVVAVGHGDTAGKLRHRRSPQSN